MSQARTERREKHNHVEEKTTRTVDPDIEQSREAARVLSTLEQIEKSMAQMAKANANLVERIAELEDEVTEPTFAENAIERAEDAGNFVVRLAKRGAKELNPRKERKTWHGMVMGGLGEYGLAVTAAQIAPVQTMNFIARILFI